MLCLAEAWRRAEAERIALEMAEEQRAREREVHALATAGDLNGLRRAAAADPISADATLLSAGARLKLTAMHAAAAAVRSVTFSFLWDFSC
eukprot:SAG31_NODE_3922_length_3749_cov_4.089315_4_plen_91_part_00